MVDPAIASAQGRDGVLMATRVSVVEALIAFLVTVLVLLVMEVTLGTVFDQMAATFAATYIPGADMEVVGNILGMFGQIHLIAGIMVVMTAVWVIRVVVMENEYDRGLYR